jgi:hypothetical protein
MQNRSRESREGIFVWKIAPANWREGISLWEESGQWLAVRKRLEAVKKRTAKNTKDAKGGEAANEQ